jgi:hypothetical protein
LGFKLRDVKVGLAKGDKDPIGSGEESPEKEYGN